MVDFLSHVLGWIINLFIICAIIRFIYKIYKSMD